MIAEKDGARDLSRLVVAPRGSLERTGDLFEAYRLVDAAGNVVVAAGAYLRELAACGRPAATQRSYGMDLLRWLRFLGAVEIGWDQATRVEARELLFLDPARGQADAASLALSRRWRTGDDDSASGVRLAEPGDREAVTGP